MSLNKAPSLQANLKTLSGDGVQWIYVGRLVGQIVAESSREGETVVQSIRVYYDTLTNEGYAIELDFERWSVLPRTWLLS